MSYPLAAGFEFAGPIRRVFPIPTSAQLRVTDLGGGNLGLRLTLPFSTPLHVTVDDLDSTVTVAGTLVLDGTAVVSEPDAELLLGGGLLALAVLRRSARVRAR
jgi:hypothetical protein